MKRQQHEITTNRELIADLRGQLKANDARLLSEAAEKETLQREIRQMLETSNNTAQGRCIGISLILLLNLKDE